MEYPNSELVKNTGSVFTCDVHGSNICIVSTYCAMKDRKLMSLRCYSLTANLHIYSKHKIYSQILTRWHWVCVIKVLVAEPNNAHVRAELQLLRRDPLLPELSCGWCHVCSGRAGVRDGKLLHNSNWETGVRDGRKAALQPLRSLQKVRSFSRCRTAAPCCTGEAYGGAGCPPAAWWFYVGTV